MTRPGQVGGSYPASLMAEVRDLHVGGWTPGEIRSLLMRRGEPRIPHHTTIAVWADPGYRERRRAEVRDINARIVARATRFAPRGSSGAYQAQLARALRAQHMPATSVAKAMRVFYPDAGWTQARVLDVLEDPQP